jgi:hypothetical protein
MASLPWSLRAGFHRSRGATLQRLIETVTCFLDVLAGSRPRQAIAEPEFRRNAARLILKG